MSLDTLVPENPNKPYDMKELIHKVVDEGDFFEIGEAFARNIITGFGRIEGSTVGFVANQPMVLAGVLDSDASRKARALRALLRLLQHSDRDLRGRARLSCRARRRNMAASSSMARSCCSLTPRRRSPKVTVITRKAYGGAYDVMASKHMRADVNYAWPTAQIAVMGAKGAVEIIFRQSIGNKEEIAERTKEYEDRFLNPFVAAGRGYIDDVIRPHSTRWRIARALRMLKNKQVPQIWKKHDNIPL